MLRRKMSTGAAAVTAGVPAACTAAGGTGAAGGTAAATGADAGAPVGAAAAPGSPAPRFTVLSMPCKHTAITGQNTRLKMIGCWGGAALKSRMTGFLAFEGVLAIIMKVKATAVFFATSNLKICRDHKK